MNGVCFFGVEEVAWRELPDPVIEHPCDAIIQVELAGLCGSDLHAFFGRERGLDRGTVMGHEFVGTVVEVGNAVTMVRTGDRVFAPFSTNCGECFYCRYGLTSRCPSGQLFGWRSQDCGLHGGQAQRVRVPLADGTLMKVPSGLTSEQALLLGDNLSTGYYCASMAEASGPGLTVVIGCGTVGLLAIQAAFQMGATKLIAVERIERRRELARSMGASVISPDDDVEGIVKKHSEGRGADRVLELVGLPEAQRLAWRLVRPGGILSVVGCHSSEHFAFSPSEAYDKNLTYRTGRCPARYWMGELVEAVIQGRWPVEQLITHRFPGSECKRAYEIFSRQQDGCIKAVFDMQFHRR